MALNFPNSPTNGQEWVDTNSMTWKFNGEMWRRQQAPIDVEEVPPGGITNQVLAKISNVDHDTDWSYIKADGGLF